MSRNYRGRQFNGLNRGPKIAKVKPQKLLSLLMNRMRQDMICKGIIPDPQDRPPRYKFTWSYGELGGEVYCDDRSTARSLIKKDLGIKKKNRLPKEVSITREVNECSDGSGTS